MSPKGQRYGVGFGRPVVYRTWFTVWMESKGFTINGFARMVCYSGAAIELWRSGKGIGRHAAQLLRARWPDCPVHLFGGPVARITDKIPANARTPELYRRLLKITKLAAIEKSIPAMELAHARGILLKPE